MNLVTEDMWLPEVGRTGMNELEGGIPDGQETFETDGYIHYLHCGDYFTDICMHQNLSIYAI